MKRIIQLFWNEPVAFIGIGTVLFASAATITNNQWIAFGTAVFAGLGTLMQRHLVTPVGRDEPSVGE